MKSSCMASAILLASLILQPLHVFSREAGIATLKAGLLKVVDTSKAIVGISILELDGDQQLTINADHRFPMQSVYKLPLAIAILNDVDKGKLSLTQIMHIPRASLDADTWTPMLQDYPGGDLDLTLEKLLDYTISKSDNNACDILFGLAGGTTVVNKYIHGLGVKDIAIAATEAEMKKGWQVQYTNWCKPAAMVQILRILYTGKALSKASKELLLKLMTESQNSPNRLNGLLPANAVVAHKTGTSNTNSKGITAATNDVGIVTLPNGKHYAIVVYVSDYKGGVSRGEHIIAALSKLTWDYFKAR